MDWIWYWTPSNRSRVEDPVDSFCSRKQRLDESKDGDKYTDDKEEPENDKHILVAHVLAYFTDYGVSVKRIKYMTEISFKEL